MSDIVSIIAMSISNLWQETEVLDELQDQMK